MLIKLESLLHALELLVGHCLLDEIEDRDGGAVLPKTIPGDNRVHVRDVQHLAKLVVLREDKTLLFVLGTMLGAIGEKWNVKIDLILHHMGVLDERKLAGGLRSAPVKPANDYRLPGRMVYLLVMQCFGHGISIVDDHAEAFEKATRILNGVGGKISLGHHPYFDQHETLTSLIDHYLVYPKE